MFVEMKYYIVNELVCSNVILKVGCVKSYECFLKVILIEEISYKFYFGFFEYIFLDDIEFLL